MIFSFFFASLSKILKLRLFLQWQKRKEIAKRELWQSFYSHIKQTVWTRTLILEISDFRPECSKICQDLCSFYVKQSLIPECNNSLLQSELPFTSQPDCWMFSSQKTLCVWRYTPPYGARQNVQIPRFPPARCWYFKLKHQLRARRNFENFFFGIAGSKDASHWLSDHWWPLESLKATEERPTGDRDCV